MFAACIAARHYSHIPLRPVMNSLARRVPCNPLLKQIPAVTAGHRVVNTSRSFSQSAVNPEPVTRLSHNTLHRISQRFFSTQSTTQAHSNWDQFIQSCRTTGIQLKQNARQGGPAVPT